MTAEARNPILFPECPPWAGGYGRDEFGVFAELVWGGVVQRLRWIASGSFQMGSPENEKGRYEDESPVHSVTIRQGFWIEDTPVTQALYAAVIGTNPSEFKEDRRRPVETVSWDDSRSFCEKVTAELPDPDEWRVRRPSEAEWEYACRAGTKGPLYNNKPLTSETGRCPNLDELAWYYANSKDTTHPVKEKAANSWGLYDMLGNVWEWCEDHWHDNYTNAPADGTAWLDAAEQGRLRVIRGGGWAEVARHCRSASRGRCGPGNRDFLGFRLVLSRSETGASLPSSRQGEANPHPGPPPSDILTSGEGVGSESDAGIADLQSALSEKNPLTTPSERVAIASTSGRMT